MTSPSPRPRPQPRPLEPVQDGPAAAGPPEAPAREPVRWRSTREERDAARAARRGDRLSWLTAIMLMLGFDAAIWIVQIVDDRQHYRLLRFGLGPRRVDGLWGLLTAPFLHASYQQTLAETAPVILIGWALLLSGYRVWLAVTATVLIGGGALAWLVAPSHPVIVGAAGLYFGWLGYLVARAVISRRIRWIVTAAMVLLFFGALLNALVPVTNTHVSWQANVCGFLAGVGVGAVLHPRRGSRRDTRRSAVS